MVNSEPLIWFMGFRRLLNCEAIQLKNKTNINKNINIKNLKKIYYVQRVLKD